jgi:hypothetical protein
MKQAVVAMDCRAVSRTEARILKRIGSAFLTSESGSFLTAAHLLMDMEDNNSCPTAAITLPSRRGPMPRSR